MKNVIASLFVLGVVSLTSCDNAKKADTTGDTVKVMTPEATAPDTTGTMTAKPDSATMDTTKKMK
jgi:hypothetical protein